MRLVSCEPPTNSNAGGRPPLVGGESRGFISPSETTFLELWDLGKIGKSEIGNRKLETTHMVVRWASGLQIEICTTNSGLKGPGKINCREEGGGRSNVGRNLVGDGHPGWHVSKLGANWPRSIVVVLQSRSNNRRMRHPHGRVFKATSSQVAGRTCIASPLGLHIIKCDVLGMPVQRRTRGVQPH